MYQVYNDELYHYGVLGMKWGHRKSNGVVSKIGRALKTHDQSIKDARSKKKDMKKEYKNAKKQYKAGEINKLQYQKTKKKYQDNQVIANTATTKETAAIVSGVNAARKSHGMQVIKDFFDPNVINGVKYTVHNANKYLMG